MVNPTTLEYARECARANPDKVNAILCLRNLIEDRGLSINAAMAAIIATFPLGLVEFEEIREGAACKYPNALLSGVV